MENQIDKNMEHEMETTEGLGLRVMENQADKNGKWNGNYHNRVIQRMHQDHICRFPLTRPVLRSSENLNPKPYISPLQ